MIYLNIHDKFRKKLRKSNENKIVDIYKKGILAISNALT